MADTYAHRTTRTGSITSTQKTLAAAGNYAAGDILSESATNNAGTDWAFKFCSRAEGTPFWITRVTAHCSADSVLARIRIHLFKATVSTASELDDNAAKNFAAADEANRLGPPIDLPAFADTGDDATAGDAAIRMRITPADGNSDRAIYGVVEILDSEANEAAAMTLRVELETVWE